MGWLPQACEGAVLGYAVTTVVDSLVHRCILHSSPAAMTFYRRHRRVFRVLLRAHHAHHFHHAKVAQMSKAASRDKRTPDAIRKEIKAMRRYPGGLLFFVTPLLLVCALAPVLGRWALLGALPAVLAYPCLPLLVHPYLHLRADEVSTVAGGWATWLLQSLPLRWLAQHHAAHHRDPRSHHNLLAGGDLIVALFWRGEGRHGVA
jgi:hypothetical protein